MAALAAILLAAAIADAAVAGAESDFVSLVNQERSSRGLRRLEVYWDLVDDARAHTQDMIAAGEIFHSSNLGSVTSGWWALGENVGVGPSPSRIHGAFMNSPSHRANILGDYNYIGVGAARAPDGSLYVTVIFMKGPDGLVSPPTTTTTTTQPSTTTTTAPAPTTTTVPAPTSTVPAAAGPVPQAVASVPRPSVAAAPQPLPAATPDQLLLCTGTWNYQLPARAACVC